MIHPARLDQCIDVPRDVWDRRAAPVLPATRTIDGITGIEFHHTVTPTDHPVRTLNGIRRDHRRRRGWTDIFYNYAIDQAGVVYELRPVERHSMSVLRSWLTVAFIGDHRTDTLTGPAKAAAYRIETCFDTPPRLRGHAERPYATLCPGPHAQAYIRARRTGWAPTITRTKDETMIYRTAAGTGVADWLATAGTVTPIMGTTSDLLHGQGVPRADVPWPVISEMRDRWARHGILDESPVADNPLYDPWRTTATGAGLGNIGENWVTTGTTAGVPVLDYRELARHLVGSVGGGLGLDGVTP